MAIRGQKSSLKRDRVRTRPSPPAPSRPRDAAANRRHPQASAGENGHADLKKPRRSARLSSQASTAVTPLSQNNPQLPSPLTRQESTTTQSFREGTVTPPRSPPGKAAATATTKPASQAPPHHHAARVVTPGSSPPARAVASPPAAADNTQPFSQFVLPSQSLSRDVLDEEREGVWGYLMPGDQHFGETLVLRKRSACARPGAAGEFGRGGKAREEGRTSLESYEAEEERYEEAKRRGTPSGGYLIGRHPECGRPLPHPFARAARWNARH